MELKLRKSTFLHLIMINSPDKLGLKSLGNAAQYQLSNPDISILEGVSNPHIDVNYNIRFSCPEFTSICPITGQPDFAHIIIDYVPNLSIVESKSLKLYLFSYRNHGAFHESCTVSIAKDLISLLQPKWFRIAGYWYPRGGIPIDVFFQHGDLPKEVWVKDHSITDYRPR